jgi:two-component sensor histidine kinase
VPDRRSLIARACPWLPSVVNTAIPSTQSAALVFALVCVSVATLIRWALGLVAADIPPFATYYPATLIASLIGGATSGLVALLLGGIVTWVLFISHPAGLIDLSLSHFISFLLYGLSAGIIILLADGYRRSALCIQMEDRRRLLLLQEAEHRSRNLISVIQSIVARSLTSGYTLDEAKTVIEGRLRALAHAHTGLNDAGVSAADLSEIITSETAAFSKRVSARGPRVRLSPRAAQMFALVVHELATNATKYGALSTPHGRVSVVWTIETNSPPSLHFRWHERGGPTVSAPQRSGFGRAIVERLVGQEFSTTPRIDYAPEGLMYDLEVEQARLQE